MTMIKVSKEEFLEKWKEGSILLCPKLKGYCAWWLYPLPKDPCISGDCKFLLCRNYKVGFRWKNRLIVPEEPMPELLAELEAVEKKDKRLASSRNVMRWL